MGRVSTALLAGMAGALAIVANPQFAAADPSILDAVKAKGSLRCGMVELGTGLATQSATGQWVGFFPDFCRAVAVAVTGNADRFTMVNVSLANRFDSVVKGAVDVLMTGTTWTLARDVDLRVSYPALYLFDGQSFMTHQSENIRNLADLKGKTVCVPKGSTTLQQTTEISDGYGLDLKTQVYETIQGTYSSFFSRQCQAVTDDATRLAANRALVGLDPSLYVILAERPIKEALYPAVRKEDEAWQDVIRWIVNATIYAEELGLTSANIDAQQATANPAVRRFLGLEPKLGQGLGLDPRWAYRVIKSVGNFGEIFDRNIGAGSALKLDRGLNRLWTKGGVMWSPPFQ